MRLNIPFIQSRGWECGQTCTAMVIKYFYPDFVPDFDEFNRIIKFKKGTYTFPLQNALILNRFKVKCRCFSADDIKTTQEEPGIFKRWYGKSYEHDRPFIDIRAYNYMVKAARKFDLFELRQTSFTQLLDYLTRKYLVIMPVDWNRLNNKKGEYDGHFVILSGQEGERVLIHDPDNGPYIAYDRKQLEYAYSHPVITQDGVVAFGKAE